MWFLSCKKCRHFYTQTGFCVGVSNLTANVFGSSKLTNYNGLKELLSGDAKAILEKLNQDSAYKLVKSIADSYQKNVAPKFDEINYPYKLQHRPNGPWQLFCHDPSGAKIELNFDSTESLD